MVATTRRISGGRRLPVVAAEQPGRHGELERYAHRRAVTVCNDPDSADAWVESEAGAASGALGLDCEWAPPWFRGDAPERVDVLQLATERSALVLSVTGLSTLPPRLAALLADGGVRKVGVNVGGDCARLARDFGTPVAGAHDLAVAANTVPEARVAKARSLADLAQAVLRVEAGDKKGGPRMSNWAQWPLTEAQVEYAAADAALSYDVYAQGPPQLREALPAEVAKPAVAAGALQPSNGQSKRKSDAEEGAGTAAPAIKKAANHDFFIAMRNRSIDPPMKGKKEYPSGGATALKGLCFVVSGVLDSMGRDECHEYIRRHGGAVAKSVTGRVTHILNDHGEVGPSKRRKAEAAGIPIVGEDALLALVSAAPKGPGSS
eukprot:jgi/Tetstr1/436564/TSEL_002718.t1